MMDLLEQAKTLLKTTKDLLEKQDNSYYVLNLKVEEIIKALKEEQTRWIPCSKRLPKKSGEYWCTFGKTNLMGSDYYTTESDAKKIFDDPEEYVGWQSHNVIAWMPLPEKYKAETEEDE